MSFFRNGNASDQSENPQILAPLSLLFKKSVEQTKDCVLKSSTTGVQHTKFAVAISNQTVRIYDKNGKLWDVYEHPKTITHIKFSVVDPSLLFTSCLDGKIRVWDTRCQGPVLEFFDDADGELKPILSFDCNVEEQIICGGTELIREDAFHLFWDRRAAKVLGGYWNSHAGDITQIRFHPHKKSCMASSSVDGLINVFDLDKDSEDDALVHSINAESAVNTITWKPDDCISSTTSIEDYHIWGKDTVQPVLTKSRRGLWEDFQVKVDYMIDSLLIQKNFFFVTGNNSGTVHLWNIHRNTLYPGLYRPVGYCLKGGHSDVVRTICYNEIDGLILTGGDDGCICYWRLERPELPSDKDDPMNRGIHRRGRMIDPHMYSAEFS